MDQIEFVQNAVKKMRYADFVNSGQLSVQELIARLEQFDPKTSVGLRFYGATLIASVDSYRGYYDELAFDVTTDYGVSDPTVGEVLYCLKQALGKTFYGWKGGEYVMNQHTPLWIAKSGTTGSKVVGVNEKYAPGKDYPGRVVLEVADHD